MKEFAIDFDGVIHDQANRVKNPETGQLYRMGRPMPGAKEGIYKIWNAGYLPVIWTVRGGEKTRQHVQDWLNFFEIPFGEITNEKRDFYKVLEDNASRYIQFNGWGKEYI